MRHKDSRIYAALDEMFRVVREAHLRAEISPLKLSGEKAWGQAEQVRGYIKAARAEWFTSDCWTRPGSSSSLSA